MKRILTLLAVLGCSTVLHASEYSVALDTLGATGRLTKGSHNRDWPVVKALAVSDHGSGLLLNAPMDSAFVEVQLLVPVPITAVEISLIDRNWRFIRTVDIYVDGKLVKEGVEFGSELVEAADARGRSIKKAPSVRVEFDGVKGSVVGIAVTSLHPPREQPNPENKPIEYGGIERIRVFSSEDISSFTTMLEAFKVADARAIAFSAALASKPETFAEVR